MKVLLHDSRLQLWQGKLRSCYIGFFIITHVFSCGAIEIHELAIGAKQKVNYQRLKQLLEFPVEENVECLMLQEPPNESRYVMVQFGYIQYPTRTCELLDEFKGTSYEKRKSGEEL